MRDSHTVKFLARRILPGVLAALLASPAWSERRALLVGVGAYPAFIKPLEGPAWDVSAMRKVLREHWGYDDGNIAVLVDQQATKPAILAGIEQLGRDSQPGDEIIIYLSGHGTSWGDLRNSALTLRESSGAFLPYISKHPATPQAWVDALLVGHSDLQQVLKPLDQGGHRVVVIMDACFSGQSVRGLYGAHALPRRISELPMSVFDGSSPAQPVGAGRARPPYPYDNIFYISASAWNEFANDIPKDRLTRYPTMDGKPHGTFTDSLLRVLAGEVAADNNGDGKLAYGELYAAVAGHMVTRGYDHSPQRLPYLEADSAGLANRTLLGTHAAAASLSVADARDQPPFSVSLGPWQHLAKTLQADVALVLDAANPDLSLQRKGGNAVLVSKSGDLITTLVAPKDGEVTDNEIVAQIRSQQAIHQWLNTETEPDFNVFVELEGGGTTVEEGAALDISVRSERQAHLLVLNIGPTGKLFLLRPLKSNELAKIAGGDLVMLRSIAQAQAPFGREIIEVYATEKLPPKVGQLMGKPFSIHSPEARELQAWLQGAEVAKATLTLYSVPQAQ